MIRIRPARLDDAPAIGAVHVAVWRSAYAGVLPEPYLAHLSPLRQAGYYHAALRHGQGAVVAEAVQGAGRRVVGFATLSRRSRDLAEGEIETLYVLDDWREQGVGRALMQGAAERLAALGCRSAFLWVLHDNPSRWFYERLRGRRVAAGETAVAGRRVAKDAYVWDPIDILLRQQATPEVPE